MKLRFAPSPTGDIHIGNLRTAIFNYLYSKKYNYKFILRIDDTDQERNNINYLNEILNIFGYLSINFDQILFQTSYLNRIHKYIEKLNNNKFIYYCICGIDRNNCICNSFNYQKGCIVFNTKTIQDIEFKDQILGNIKIPKNTIKDFIIVRENGMPLYNFITVVSDIEENISHIIRGGDHVMNTWKQVIIYKALNIKQPIYIHIPLIINKDNSKISKRSINKNSDNNTFKSIKQLLSLGYLRTAILNCIIKLGWSYKNYEIFTMNDIIQYFTESNFSVSNCIYDEDKLKNLNIKHIKNIKADDISLYCMLNNIKEKIQYTSYLNEIQIINRVKNIQEYINICNIINLKYISIENLNSLSKEEKNQLYLLYDDILKYKEKTIEIIQNKNYQNILRIIFYNKKDGISISNIAYLINPYSFREKFISLILSIDNS